MSPALADVTVVVLVPGMGDDIQAIKAGVMEIADIFVINKADRPGAEQTQREIEGMLSLGHGATVPAIFRTVAIDGTGVAELLDDLESRQRKTARRATNSTGKSIISASRSARSTKRCRSMRRISACRCCRAKPSSTKR